MELIIKPTSKCNFSCKFCAASELDIIYSPHSVPQQIKDIIRILKPDGIIITGGEPLCCDPEYYEELLSISDCNIVFTTNLKEFWLYPDKWTPIFRNERVRVGTSFNYGMTRLWDKNNIYIASMFRDVINLFKERIGYAPPFISVIDESNEDMYFAHVLLAKELGTYCRLNNALKMGKQEKHYPRYKMFKMWIDIIDKGFEEYEQNCFERTYGRCPINSNLMCQSAIRAVYVDSNNKIHYSNCEDKLNRNNGCEIPIDTIRPIPIPTLIKYHKNVDSKCFTCDLYNICHACITNRENIIDTLEYCSEMMKIKNDIIRLGWKL